MKIKKEKMLTLGVYSIGLALGSVVGTVSSKALFPEISPVFLGAGCATLFSRYLVGLYKGSLQERLPPSQTNNMEDELNFFKKTKPKV